MKILMGFQRDTMALIYLDDILENPDKLKEMGVVTKEGVALLTINAIAPDFFEESPIKNPRFAAAMRQFKTTGGTVQ